MRVMDADSASYGKQLRRIKKKHQEKKDLEGGEYLSGFSKQDRLIPVITLVLYFGMEPWDGARSLKEMLDLSELPEGLKELVSDYPMHLLEVRNYEHLENFKIVERVKEILD